MEGVEQRPAMRVSDRERGEVADLLQRHAAAGRLDPEELDARLDAALSARTTADLAPLTHDLPDLGPEQARPQRRAVPPALRPALVRWAIANLALIAIWLATGDGIHDFWPKWFLVVSTIALVARSARHWTHADDEPAPPALPR